MSSDHDDPQRWRVRHLPFFFFLSLRQCARGKTAIFWSSVVDFLTPSEYVRGAAVHLLWPAAVGGLVASDHEDLPDGEYVVSFLSQRQDARGAAAFLLLAVRGRSASSAGDELSPPAP